MKWIITVFVASLVGGGALVAASGAAFAEGATVINWGKDKADCTASCGPFTCVENGKLTIVTTPSGNSTLTCTDGDWLLDPFEKAFHVDVDCGELGSGKGVITPAGKVNFTCHN